MMAYVSYVIHNPVFIGVLAVFFGLCSIGFLINLILGIAQRKRYRDAATARKYLTQRAALFTVCLIATLALVACGNANRNNIPEDGTDPAATSQTDGADPVDPNAPAEPEDETPPAPEPEDFQGEALEHVILTMEQMEDFISKNGYSVKFDDSSKASRLRERIDAQGKYDGEVFDNPLDFPWDEIMTRLDDLKAGKISGDELDSWLKDIRKDLYQKVIANPVIGDAWARMLAESPLVTENNQWLVTFVQKMDEFYAITQVQEISNEDILNGAKPGLVPAGLDYCISKLSDGTLVVNEWYRFNAVRLCYLLDNFTFTGEITTKTSIRNIGFAITAEDSYSRGVFMQEQENEPALRLVHRQKALDGKAQVILEYGLNPRDGRPEEFDPKVIPVVPEPEKTYTPPAKDDPEPELPKETYVNVTFEHREKGTEIVLRDSVTVSRLKTGTSYTYTAPVIPGYVCETPSYPITVPGVNKTYTVYYTKEQPKAQLLTIDYIYEEDGTTAAPTHVEQVNVGASFSVRSPDITGYTPDIAVVRGTMDEDGEYFLVKYKRIELTIVVEHRYEDGSKVRSLPDHVETVKYGKSFYYIAPSLAGYTWTPPYISIDKVVSDGTYVIWYKQITKTDTPKDGEGIKDPQADPANQGNAPVGGGSNKPSDGTGDYEPDEPPLNDGVAGSYEPDPTPPEQEEKPVVVGTGDNTDPPPTDPIPVDTDTTITDPATGTVDQDPNDDGEIGGFLPMP